MSIKMRLAYFAIAFALLSGCGGGGGGSSATRGGSAVFTIHWPTKSRVIPPNTQSIKITIFELRNGQPFDIASALVPAPVNGGTSSTTIDNLPAGPLTAKIEAFPKKDGTGTPLASATTPVDINLDKPATVGITMASTIATFNVEPAGGSSTLVTLNANNALLYIATALDSNGNIVPVDPSSLQWEVDHTNIATVQGSVNQPSALVTGHLHGSATVKVTDPASGKSAQSSFIVNPVVSQLLWVDQIDLGVQTQLVVDVAGVTDSRVTWSLDPTSIQNGGTLVQDQADGHRAIFTAPRVGGDATITVTLVETNTPFFFNIHVRAGSGVVIIQ